MMHTCAVNRLTQDQVCNPFHEDLMTPWKQQKCKYCTLGVLLKCEKGKPLPRDGFYKGCTPNLNTKALLEIKMTEVYMWSLSAELKCLYDNWVTAQTDSGKHHPCMHIEDWQEPTQPPFQTNLYWTEVTMTRSQCLQVADDITTQFRCEFFL